MAGKRVREHNPAAPTKRGLLYYIGVGLSAGLLALVVFVGMLVLVVPAVAGATPLTVLTSSMEPKLPPGTLIIIKPVDPMAINVGDVITYQIESGKAGVVTHRVVGIANDSNGERSFTTQGDNNDLPDALPVEVVQIQGGLWYSVPWIGYVNNLVAGENRAWLIPAAAIALFLYAGYMVASGITTAVRKRREARRVHAEPASALPSNIGDDR